MASPPVTTHLSTCPTVRHVQAEPSDLPFTAATPRQQIPTCCGTLAADTGGLLLSVPTVSVVVAPTLAAAAHRSQRMLPPPVRQAPEAAAA